MKKISFLLFYLLLTLMIFGNSEKDDSSGVIVSEVIIIDILKPPYYSGTNLTYYTIIAYKDNELVMFFLLCAVKDDIEFLENEVRELDIEKGEKYIFQYVQRNIYGVVHGHFTIINLNVNCLIGYQNAM